MPQMKDDLAIATRLAAIRSEVLESLKLFHTHVQHTITLLFAVFVAAGYLIKPDSAPAPTQLSGTVGGSYFTVAATLLLMLFPLAALSIAIIGRYYRLYVATLVESARLHRIYDDTAHAWYRQLEEYQERYKFTSDDQLIAKRTYGVGHSLFLYSILLALVGLTGTILGTYAMLTK